MLEEAERAVTEESKESEFPKDPFTGQQHRIETANGVEDYVFNGTTWIFSPVSMAHADPEESAKYQIIPELITEIEDSKKKTTYIIKNGAEQIQKTKE
jgi:hypothetical protein